EHDGRVPVVTFSRDGTRIATGSDDGNARIFDAATGNELFRLAHDGPVRAVAFSRDGTRIATGSNDSSARIWFVNHPTRPVGGRGRRLGAPRRRHVLHESNQP